MPIGSCHRNGRAAPAATGANLHAPRVHQVVGLIHDLGRLARRPHLGTISRVNLHYVAVLAPVRATSPPASALSACGRQARRRARRGAAGHLAATGVAVMLTPSGFLSAAAGISAVRTCAPSAAHAGGAAARVAGGESTQGLPLAAGSSENTTEIALQGLLYKDSFTRCGPWPARCRPT